jgi:hypothetical protein
MFNVLGSAVVISSAFFFPHVITINIKIKPSRPGGGHGKPLNFHKSSGRPGDNPTDPPKEFQVGEPSVAESRLYSAGLSAKARSWCPAGPARNTRKSVVGHF